MPPPSPPLSFLFFPVHMSTPAPSLLPAADKKTTGFFSELWGIPPQRSPPRESIAHKVGERPSPTAHWPDTSGHALSDREHEQLLHWESTTSVREYLGVDGLSPSTTQMATEDMKRLKDKDDAFDNTAQITTLVEQLTIQQEHIEDKGEKRADPSIVASFHAALEALRALTSGKHPFLAQYPRSLEKT